MSKENILKTTKFKCSTSSTLNKDPKQYGKKFMFDEEEDTSWSSDQGTPQWITLQFEDPQKISSLHFQFQGGFVGNDGQLKIEDRDGNCLYDESFYPDDINSVQKFELKKSLDNAFKLKITFKSSSDFFGRIIVYKLEIFN